MKLGPILNRVKSEIEKQISHVNAYIWNLENSTNEPIFREGMEMQM